jgi:hypothetical protein
MTYAHTRRILLAAVAVLPGSCRRVRCPTHRV